MPFELFDPNVVRDARSKKPIVSLFKSSQFGFNRVAFETLGRPGYVILFFDRERRAIGFKASKEGEFGNYRVNPSNRHVQASAMFKVFDLRSNETRRYEAIVEGDLLVVQLEPVVQPAEPEVEP